jgi:hypothetical protein
MDSLAEAGTNVELEVGAPRPSAERHVMLLRSRIVEIIEALYLTDTAKPDIIEFPAELIMHNKRTRAFEVRRLSDQQLFKGKVTGAALDAAGHASFHHLYRVRLVVTTKYNKASEIEKTTNEMIELSDLTPEAADQASKRTLL